ncbi:oxidoreductase [Streptomyces sp. NPDC050145]|uniref:oxidoreductase n=1 Tax=Streptomyces sp. NPDC050145 TaxID=3365602 RepID=UPI0037B2DF83
MTRKQEQKQKRQDHRDAGPTAEPIADQTGRVYVVTGASGGLGLATCRALARRGARVVLAVRDPEKGRRAAASITTETPGAHLEVRPLDLADLASVRAFADALRADHTHIDVLVNNAGIMAPPHGTSPQGHELQFATNHLGHFALTGLLLDLLTAGTDPRVVTVSSPNHRQGRLDLDGPKSADGPGGYSPMGHYNRSKLANAVFGHQLHLRLTAAGSKVRSVLAHPGYTATGLQHGTPVRAVRLLYGRLLSPLAQSPEAGARSQLYAATEPGVSGGEFIGPGGAGELRGAPTRVALAPRATDEHTGRLLWELSERLTEVRYPLPAPRTS